MQVKPQYSLRESGVVVWLIRWIISFYNYHFCFQSFIFSFNVIVFSSEVTCYSNDLVVANKYNCSSVVEWVHSFKCYGTTSTMQALNVCSIFSHLVLWTLPSTGFLGPYKLRGGLGLGLHRKPVGLRFCNKNWYIYSLLYYKYSEKNSFWKNRYFGFEDK